MSELTSLPDFKHDSPKTLIEKFYKNSGCKVVVLDDDPTGTQTVFNVSCLTTWDEEAIQNEFINPEPLFYILTNSRSLSSVDAYSINKLIGERIAGISVKCLKKYILISRSDSTLRGHFPVEIDALRKGLGAPDLPCLLAPAFFPGGRITVNDKHYVKDGKDYIEADKTEFAADPYFGYHNSNLKLWVEEKSSGKVRAGDVAGLSLETIRNEGYEGVKQFFNTLKPGQYAVINAYCQEDLDIVSHAFWLSINDGKSYLIRSAASIVASLMGLPKHLYLSGKELTVNPDKYPDAEKNGGLMILGSYVEKSTRQLHYLINELEKNNRRFVHLELNAGSLIGSGHAEKIISDLSIKADQGLASGKAVLLTTSRDLIRGKNSSEDLQINKTVADALISVVKGINRVPRFFIAKGGITSSTMATECLRIKRAFVLGQAMAGVPVWKCGPESKFPGLPYVIFPGNVGEDSALYELLKDLIP
ncbi:MAG: hydroxyacid dehydrogenase [Desulfobacteraceae bacterium]|nr:MAG: hydroxyacid dehydrogenase [Desulfobacteraceae bacterium]